MLQQLIIKQCTLSTCNDGLQDAVTTDKWQSCHCVHMYALKSFERCSTGLAYGLENATRSYNLATSFTTVVTKVTTKQPRDAGGPTSRTVVHATE